MKITIINVANKMTPWVVQACDEYLKRINFGKYSCKLVEIKATKNPNRPSVEILQDEAKKIKNQIQSESYVIALDEKGIQLSSVKFADKLQQIALHNPHITFIIGGADGIDEELKKTANLILQLSSFTYPHGLVRVIILEQIYRAITILDNHPYHRE